MPPYTIEQVEPGTIVSSGNAGIRGQLLDWLECDSKGAFMYLLSVTSNLESKFKCAKS